ncbi:class I SAM-dependent methyltransferase [Gammaproteobacteria bacterium]|nr:class I SAM-dependent methyltransferase [Gammaproteobacteria bacterium]
MDKAKVKSFVEQVFGDMAGAMTAGLGYVGVQTGLFRAMQGRGLMSINQVVEASGLQSRYVEEWLKGMVCAGYLDYDPDQETFALPDEHAYLLASDGSDHFAGAMFSMAPVLLGVAPQVADAFRHGGGVSFDHYGDEGIDALDQLNRGNYEHKFVSYWLPTMPNVVASLESGARVLDIGCGTGRASIVLSTSFPNSRFTGIDLNQESINRANQSASQKGVADRVLFETLSIQDMDSATGFDLIMACDCVHDFSDPVNTLVEIRNRLNSGGTFFVIEPRAEDRLEDNKHSVGTMFYGYSVFHCMTQSLAGGGPGLGTCMGPARTEALMREAGFTEFKQLDIKSQVNLFYAVN